MKSKTNFCPNSVRGYCFPEVYLLGQQLWYTSNKMCHFLFSWFCNLIKALTGKGLLVYSLIILKQLPSKTSTLNFIILTNVIRKFILFMHNVEKWPSVILKSCGVNITCFIYKLLHFSPMIITFSSNFVMSSFFSPFFHFMATHLAINVWEFCISFSTWSIQESASPSNVWHVFCNVSIFEFQSDISKSTSFICTSSSEIFSFLFVSSRGGS